MSKARIRKDIHSFYVRSDGYVFRPVAINSHMKYKSLANYKEGDQVIARHQPGTQLATIRIGDVVEVWFSHGSYLDKTAKIIPSEKVWIAWKPS